MSCYKKIISQSHLHKHSPNLDFVNFNLHFLLLSLSQIGTEARRDDVWYEISNLSVHIVWGAEEGKDRIRIEKLNNIYEDFETSVPMSIYLLISRTQRTITNYHII